MFVKSRDTYVMNKKTPTRGRGNEAKINYILQFETREQMDEPSLSGGGGGEMSSGGGGSKDEEEDVAAAAPPINVQPALRRRLRGKQPPSGNTLQTPT